MKRKARIQTGIDDRLVAIYARKSRITNKGDSIGVQFKQSADYAINQLSLPEDYEFARYEDKGLSGYYSDRPDFQRLLRDIEMGKIKAVACYKLDRISRKTSDLMRLLEYFERHDVTLLVCSNNINTRISTSKIIIQVLAIIAEFERDILTERIQDNLMELAKDGRWLGGKTPTGFSSQRVTTGSGKNKSAISFLVPVQEEKEIVLEIYGTFWETRSLLQTANIINEKYETKHGAKFTTSAIRLILRNPIYCVADEYSYNYFLEHDGNLFGEPSDFDGQHGLTAYNKTDQMKVEDEDSTFFNPKFSQLLTRKPISEWIVSVGRHEGFISSRKWVETQNMLDEIAEKYNRPHRKTNALLSGLMYCPICGKRLRVLPESNRWTNGKPRFKYACPGVRAKECTFKGVEGVTLDEFVIHSLSSLQEEHSDYYRQLLENRVASMIRTDQSEKEYQETKKAIERLNADIAAQVRNLREADDALKRFIQDDIKELTDELAKREAALRRMEDTQSENQYLIHELNGMKKRLLSFEEFAKGAQPEALFTLVHSIVDRIYITTDGTKQKCQVYIKGCATEDYSDVLGAAGYIEEEPLLPVASYVPPMCDLDYYSIFDVHVRRLGLLGVHDVEVVVFLHLPLAALDLVGVENQYRHYLPVARVVAEDIHQPLARRVQVALGYLPQAVPGEDDVVAVHQQMLRAVRGALCRGASQVRALRTPRRAHRLHRVAPDRAVGALEDGHELLVRGQHVPVRRRALDPRLLRFPGNATLALEHAGQVHVLRHLVPVHHKARAVRAEHGVRRVRRVRVRVVARRGDDRLGVVALRVAAGEAGELAAALRVRRELPRVAAQLRDRRAAADDRRLALRLRRRELRREPRHIRKSPAHRLLRQAQRELIPGLKQHSPARGRRRAQALTHRAVSRLAEVPALGVLRVRAAGAERYPHVRERRAGQRAEVRLLREVREYEPLPVCRELVFPAVRGEDHAAPRLSRLEQQVHLRIVPQRLVVAHALDPGAYRLLIEDAALIEVTLRPKRRSITH